MAPSPCALPSPFKLSHLRDLSHRSTRRSVNPATRNWYGEVEAVVVQIASLTEATDPVDGDQHYHQQFQQKRRAVLEQRF